MKKCVKNLFTEEENVELVSFDQQGCDHKICVEHFVNEGKIMLLTCHSSVCYESRHHLAEK